MDGFVGIDLGSAAFAVTSGQVLSIVQLPDTDQVSGAWKMQGGAPDPYPGGTALTNTDDNLDDFRLFVPTAPVDFAFRTFVDPEVQVPQPPVLVLLGTGLPALALLARARTRRG